MKPLKLMMQAFGPYADKEEIDFAKLGNRTMFVISGKTGSGKTTIFDGISYAIYGKASGEDRNGTELRSQFSDDEVPTEISLEFSLRNKTYYIWRSPQQEKKKSRGDGYTTVGAKAELYVVNEGGDRQLLAANVRDTDEKIKEIIQLDSNQFRQILMIPQGEFRKLLTSDSKDKETILQRLFHTELYKRVEEQLKEEASSIKKIVETKVDERSQHLRSIFQIDNEALKLAIEEDVPNDFTILPLLTEEITKMKRQLTDMNNEMEGRKKERDDAKKKLDEAAALLSQFESMNQLKKKKEELLSQRNEIDHKKKEIEDAYKASRLEQQDLLCHRLKREYDGCNQEFKHSEAQLTHMLNMLELAEKQYKLEEEKSEKRQQLANEIFRLTNLEEEIYSFAERQDEVVKLEQYQKTLETNISQTKQQLFKLEKDIEINRSNQKALEETRIKMFENERDLENLNSSLQMLRKLQTILQKEGSTVKMLETKRKNFDHVLQRLQDAKNTYSVLEHKWQLGQAGILAEKLISGQPCPVCGSTEHPQQKKSEGELPSESDLKAAKKDVEKIEIDKTKVETEWLEIKAAHESLQAAITEQIAEVAERLPNFSLEDLEPLRIQFQGKQLELSQLVSGQKEQLENLSKMERLIEGLENQLKQGRENLELLQQKEKVTSQRFIEKKTAIESSIQNIPADIRTKEQYNKKVATVSQQKKQLDEAFETASKQVNQVKETLAGVRASNEQLAISRKKAEDNLKIERGKFLSMMNEQGFSGYQQFSQAKRSSDSIKQLEQQVQLYGEEFRSVSDRFLDISERLANVEQPEMQVLQQQFAQLEEILLRLSESQTNMMMNIRHNENIMERVNTINHTIKDAEEKYQLIGHLSDIARGQNTYRITFERYVLAAFLDDILHVANIRLSKMTGGRYHLLRKTDRSKGNVQSGLELLIFDQYTGQERHVKTLSGGESFKAALALALGLADVVQQYAGGVSLETMFIDEGFGTLDPESLDHAIEALMDVQSSGRLVGIISHVPELKERIDARLEVIAGQSGSRTEFQFFG